jgi:hypothetical protein
MPKLSEIFDIKKQDDKPVTEPKQDKKPKKKREFTEEQMNVLRERLKIGRATAAANRAAKKAVPEPEQKTTDVKLETKVAAAIEQPATNKEVKTITKSSGTPSLPEFVAANKELDEGDDMDPKELKSFITKLYKASKSNIVLAAQAQAQKAKETKSESVPKTTKLDDDRLFDMDEQIPRRPINQITKQTEQPKAIPAPVQPPKVSKEEQMRIASLAKVKAALAAKKRR